MFQREPYLALVIACRLSCPAEATCPCSSAERTFPYNKHKACSLLFQRPRRILGWGLTLDISTWRLSAAACTASISAGAPAREAGALFLLQAWSTGVIAISRNSLVLLMPFILPRACCYSHGDLRARYHFLPSLVFVAALQDELKASTSFLHLL